MSVSVQLATVAEGISQISVAGVTMKDIDQVPENCLELCPIFFPRPDRFLSNVVYTPQSVGPGSSRQADLAYTLTYSYLHAPIVGGLGGLFEVYSGMLAKVVLVMNAIISNDSLSGAVDVELKEIGPGFVVQDPAGNTYHGCDVAIRIMEFIN